MTRVDGCILQDSRPDKEDTLEEVFSWLRKILIPFKKQGMGWAHVAKSILGDSSMVINLKDGKFCRFYRFWKLHKAANVAGLHGPPIAAATDCVSCHIICTLNWMRLSGDIHMSRLHHNVIRDSLDLVRITEGHHFDDADKPIMITVVALYSAWAQDDCAAVVYGATYQATISFKQTLKDFAWRWCS